LQLLDPNFFNPNFLTHDAVGVERGVLFGCMVESFCFLTGALFVVSFSILISALLVSGHEDIWPVKSC